MPKVTRKPGAGHVVPAQRLDKFGWMDAEAHPDDELGFSWTPDRDDQKDAAKADAIDRLVDALVVLRERNDARPLVRVLLDQGRLPRAVRAGFWLWLGDPLPPRPEPLTPKDQATREAVCAYHREPVPRSKDGARQNPKPTANRVLNEQPFEQPGLWRKQGVTAELLLSVARGDGKAYERIRDYEEVLALYNEE